jgi:TRAP-type C4-dicarboxylate transport system permease small subunit
MRRALDALYLAAGYAAALFMIGTLAMVLAGVTGRLFGFYLRGTDAYAGYYMAASSFLALAHTLKRGEHIRVTLILQHVPERAHRALEVWCFLAATFLAGALAYFSMRLAWQSYAFNDISQGADATPLWLPQLSMAAGCMVMFIAFADDLVCLLRGRPNMPQAAGGEPAHIE